MMRGNNLASNGEKMGIQNQMFNPHLEDPVVDPDYVNVDVDKKSPKDPEEDGISGESKLSLRKSCSFAIILLMVIAMVVLVVLGIIYLPPQKKIRNLNCDIDFSKGNSDIKCEDFYSDKFKSASRLKIYFKGKLHFSTDINLQTLTTAAYGNWTLRKAGDEMKVSLEMNTTQSTCNDAGIYLIQYQDDDNNVLFQKNKTVYVLANLSPLVLKITPHLTEDGKNKSILLEATMSTGCRHGTIAPILMKDDKVVFVEKSSCTSNFNQNVGGTVSCTTEISESVWNSVDKVITELQPNNDLPSNIKPNVTKTSDVKIEDVCKHSYLQYGKFGKINCKKIIEAPVGINVYHKSSFFGKDKLLIGEISGKIRKEQNGRVVLESTTRGALLDVTLYFINVHCDDQGNITINFTDGAEIHIKVDVQGIIEQCDADRSYETNPTNNFILECSWCPGHHVSEVNVAHVEDVSDHTASDPAGVQKPPYPVTIDMTKDVKNAGNVNVSIGASVEYGLLKVKVEMLRTACNYDEYYKFSASSTEGQSKRLVNVTMRAPSTLFVDDLSFPNFYVQDKKATVTFEGFLGCFPTSVEMKTDGDISPTRSVVEYDEVHAKVAVIEWLFDPADKAKHDKNQLSAYVKFTRASGITQEYRKQTAVEVLDDSICDVKGVIGNGCLVQHPTDKQKFVMCSAGKTIVSVTKCAAALVFRPEDGCKGQCDYPQTNGR